MASMISFFGVSARGCDEVPPNGYRWDGKQDLSSNLSRLKCPIAQMKFLLEQSLITAYYTKFLGLKCHDVISDYINELNSYIDYRFARVAENGKIFQDSYLKIYQMLQSLVKFNRGGNWVDLNIKLVCEFLFDGEDRITPIVFSREKKAYLIAFLMWMNRTVQEGYEEYSATEPFGVISFYCDTWGSGCNIVVYTRFHPIGLTFSSKRTPIDAMTAVSMLGFMSHMNWSNSSFELFAGIMSEMCIHADINKVGLTGNHVLAYILRTGFNFESVDRRYARLVGIIPEMPSANSVLFSGVLEFLQYCSRNCGMTATDKTLVAKIFGILAATKEQKQSAAYLAKMDATASAEEHTAFRHTMGACEALQLISQSPSLITAQTGSQVTGSTEEATTGGKNEGNADPKTSTDTKETGNKEGSDNPDGKKEGDASGQPEEVKESDLGPDDTSAEEGDDPNGSPDMGGDDGNGSGEPSTTDPSSTQPASAPAEPNTSDDKGIEFVITPPESSTVDSVLFREEMYKFLTNVLTNPPKCMSPQDIATLTALKRFWLSSLSIETIRGIVEACIRLPKSINNSIRKSTEYKNEQ